MHGGEGQEKEGPRDRIKDNCLAAKKREKEVDAGTKGGGIEGTDGCEPAERYRTAAVNASGRR